MSEAKAAALSRQERQSSMRSAILDAGRKSAAQDGVANLSLSSVATIAGLNPATVFGLFRNKEDLVLATIADDLFSLAAAMRGRLYPAQEATTESVRPEAGLDQKGTVNVIKEDSRPSLSPSPSSLVFADKQTEELADSERPEHLLPSASSLHEFDGRLQEAEAAATRSVSLAEQGMKALFDRIESFERQQKDVLATLMQRTDEAERKQRATTSELRMAINDIATRIEILESARLDEQRRGPFIAEPAKALNTLLSAETGTPHAEDRDCAFREAAERAASAAAALVEIQPLRADPENPRSQRSSHFWFRIHRRRWIPMTTAAAVALMLGALVAFSLGKARGRDMQLAALTAQTSPSSVLSSSLPSRSAQGSSDGQQRPTLMSLANSGNRDAALLLGLNYLHGKGVTPDQLKAARFIRRSAQEGDPLAQYWLAVVYQRGDGVGADAGEAVRWYAAAAMHGNRKAMHALGVAYAQGLGVRKDYAESARWFSKAAVRGLVNSQFNLGVLFERGLGVKQSLIEAYRWYALAAAQKDQESRARIEAIKTQLKPAEIAAADRAVGSFRPIPEDASANDLPRLARLPADR